MDATISGGNVAANICRRPSVDVCTAHSTVCARADGTRFSSFFGFGSYVRNKLLRINILFDVSMTIGARLGYGLGLRGLAIWIFTKLRPNSHGRGLYKL